MQRSNTLNVRNWLPIAFAIVVILLIAVLFGNAAGPGPSAINPTFGLTALANLAGGTVNLLIGLLPLVLAVIAGYFLVRWWLAPDDLGRAGSTGADLPAAFTGASRKTEIACPACAAPVRDRWQACPSCGYRMHVINDTPACPTCRQPVDREWRVCPHCAAALPTVPEEQRVPARAMVEAARARNSSTAIIDPAGSPEAERS